MPFKTLYSEGDFAFKFLKDSPFTRIIVGLLLIAITTYFMRGFTGVRFRSRNIP